MRVEAVVSWVAAVESCVESPVVTLVGSAVDQSPAAVTVSNTGSSVQSWEGEVSWAAVVPRDGGSSVVSRAGPLDDLFSVAVVARVPREGISVLSWEVGLSRDGVEAMTGAVVISAGTLVTGCLAGVKVFDSLLVEVVLGANVVCLGLEVKGGRAGSRIHIIFGCVQWSMLVILSF